MQQAQDLNMKLRQLIEQIFQTPSSLHSPFFYNHVQNVTYKIVLVLDDLGSVFNIFIRK